MRSFQHLKLEFLGFGTWVSNRYFDFDFSSCSLFFHHYTCFIRCFETIQELGYNAKFGLDLILFPLFSFWL